MPPKPKEPWPVPSPNYQGSLGDYKESVSPTRRNFARQPTYESPGDAYVRLNRNNSSIFQEIKSMLDPKNLTGANAIETALGINGKGKGLPITQRVTSGLSGLVQGLSFAAGGSAGKVGVEGIKNTGLPARVANKVKGEIVVVHGTGRPIVGNTINPRAGSPISPDIPAVSTWNTNYGKGTRSGQDWIHGNVQEYANRPYYDPVLKKKVPGQGNIVIGKTKLKDTLLNLTEPNQPVLLSGKPVPITKVIKDNPALSELANKEIFIKELKRAGAKVNGSPIKNMLDKVEQQKLLKRKRIADKNSPV